MVDGNNDENSRLFMINFIPVRPYNDALERARRDVTAWNMLRSTGAEKERQWADWARDELEGMMRFPSRTMLQLESANERLRLGAVALLVDYWPPREWFAAPCLRLAFEDTESPIRGCALKGVSRLKMYISDRTGWLENLLEALYGRLSPGEAASARRTVQGGLESIRQFERETMKKLAGSQLDSMLKSRAAAESFLGSADPQMRSAALFVLAHRWELNRELADRCEAVALGDPDAKVRKKALANLGAFYHRSDDRRIGQMLARIVCDHGQPIDLRVHAYRLLFDVRGMPSDVTERARSLSFRFPEDVDWLFVESFVGRQE